MQAADRPQVFTPDDPGMVSHFDATGWAIVRLFDEQQAAAIAEWVDEVAAWPDDVNVLHYRERTATGPQLCRTEYFVPFHHGFRELLTAGPMLHVAGALLREPAVLYKEKINYKLAGGAGYSAHQDAPAYPFIDRHLSCMIAVDDADEHNGCLEVVSGMHHELLPTDDVGCIPAGLAATFDWSAAPVRAGDTLWFHSRTPHRSGANRSTQDRRAIYPTYNAASEGDLREAYYEEKLARMAAARVGDRVQVSLIGDFQGEPV